MPWLTDSCEDHPLDLFLPTTASPESGLLIWLPGYDGWSPREDPHWTAALDDASLVTIVPQASRCCWTPVVEPSFGASGSPLDFLQSSLTAWARERFGADVRFSVTGVELGGQGALQLAYRQPRLFPIVAAISPKIDLESWWGFGLTLDDLFESGEAARQQSATLHLHPLNWPRYQLLLCDPEDPYAYDGTLTLASKLSSSGIPYQKDFETTHGGFGPQYASAVAGRVAQFCRDSLKHLASRFDPSAP